MSPLLLALFVLDAAPSAATPVAELAATTTVAGPATTTAATTCHIAVLDLEAQGLPADEAHVPRVLTDALAARVAERSGCQVITRQDIASMVGFEADRQACGGDADASCLAEIGSALGVEKLVAGSIARLGSSTTISVRLLDMKGGRVLTRAERSVADTAALRDATAALAADLFAGTSTTSAARVPWLWWTGATAASVGLLGALASGGIVFWSERVLGNATSLSSEKNAARRDGWLAIGGLGLSTTLVIGGALATTMAGGE